jgi:DNA-binding IclR family transcriptional regulator
MIDLVESSGQRLTAAAIAQACGYPKPTVNRILAALVRRGLLAIDRRDQSYELGMRFTQLAATLRRSHHLVTHVEEYMISLSARSSETVSLGVAELTAARIVGRYHMGLEGVPGGIAGAKRPYHASAIGKALLSGMPERQALRHIARISFERFTPATFVKREQLMSDLQVIRARGYALDNEEIVSGTRCVAVPIFTSDGTVVAAASLSAPSYRMTEERIAEIAAALEVIAAVARERMPVSPGGSRMDDDMTCLRSGGLFHPVAMAANDEHVWALDAGARALRTFSREGVLLESDAIPAPFDAAALRADGGMLLARGRDLEISLPGQATKRTELAAPVVALASGQDGAGYVLTRDGTVHDVVSGRQVLVTSQEISHMAVAGPHLCACGDGQVVLYDTGNGAAVRHLDFEGRAQALAATGSHIWIANGRQILRMTIATGNVDKVDAPESRITAMTISGADVWLAGANFGAPLSDFGGMTRNAGALYRWAQQTECSSAEPAKAEPLSPRKVHGV